MRSFIRAVLIPMRDSHVENRESPLKLFREKPLCQTAGISCGELLFQRRFSTVSVLCRKHLAYIRSPRGQSRPARPHIEAQRVSRIRSFHCRRVNPPETRRDPADLTLWWQIRCLQGSRSVRCTSQGSDSEIPDETRFFVMLFVTFSGRPQASLAQSTSSRRESGLRDG